MYRVFSSFFHVFLVGITALSLIFSPFFDSIVLAEEQNNSPAEPSVLVLSATENSVNAPPLISFNNIGTTQYYPEGSNENNGTLILNSRTILINCGSSSLITITISNILPSFEQLSPQTQTCTAPNNDYAYNHLTYSLSATVLSDPTYAKKYKITVANSSGGTEKEFYLDESTVGAPILSLIEKTGTSDNKTYNGNVSVRIEDLPFIKETRYAYSAFSETNQGLSVSCAADRFRYIGTRAQASATFSVDNISITNAGSGYTSIPTVTISGGSGTGTVATATIGTDANNTATYQKIISIAVTAGGSGYTSIPIITISGGGGTGAAATVTMSVNAISITNAGSGYTSTPTITISGGSGTGTVATATIGTDKKIISIAVAAGGSGYTAIPIISIEGPFVGSAWANNSPGIGSQIYYYEDTSAIPSVVRYYQFIPTNAENTLGANPPTHTNEYQMCIIPENPNAGSTISQLVFVKVIQKNGKERVASLPYSLYPDVINVAARNDYGVFRPSVIGDVKEFSIPIEFNSEINTPNVDIVKKNTSIGIEKLNKNIELVNGALSVKVSPERINGGAWLTNGEKQLRVDEPPAGGTQATATAIVSNGSIVIRVDATGSGYTTVPNIFFSDDDSFVITRIEKTNANNYTIVGNTPKHVITNTILQIPVYVYNGSFSNDGNSPLVTTSLTRDIAPSIFLDSESPNIIGAFVYSNNSSSEEVARTGDTVTFEVRHSEPVEANIYSVEIPSPIAVTATVGTPTVVGGSITNIPIANLGNGYTTAPTITLPKPTKGIPPTFTVAVNEENGIDGLRITNNNRGSGLTNGTARVEFSHNLKEINFEAIGPFQQKLWRNSRGYYANNVYKIKISGGEGFVPANGKGKIKIKYKRPESTSLNDDTKTVTFKGAQYFEREFEVDIVNGSINEQIIHPTAVREGNDPDKGLDAIFSYERPTLINTSSTRNHVYIDSDATNKFPRVFPKGTVSIVDGVVSVGDDGVTAPITFDDNKNTIPSGSGTDYTLITTTTFGTLPILSPVLSNGGVTNITITNGGTGYESGRVNPSDIIISPPEVKKAVATLSINNGAGSVASVNLIDGGKGYSNSDVTKIKAPAPFPLSISQNNFYTQGLYYEFNNRIYKVVGTVEVVVNIATGERTLISPTHISGVVNGFEYVGARATLIPTITNGSISAITIDPGSAGAGYQLNKKFYFKIGGVEKFAECAPQQEADISLLCNYVVQSQDRGLINPILKLDRITVVNEGFGYINTPSVTISSPIGTQLVSAWISNGVAVRNNHYSHTVEGVTHYYKFIGTSSTLGTIAPIHTFGVVDGFQYVGTQALAVATIASTKLTGVTITNPGSGYLTIPTIVISSPTGVSAWSSGGAGANGNYYSITDSGTTRYYKFIGTTGSNTLGITVPTHTTGTINNFEYMHTQPQPVVVPRISYDSIGTRDLAGNYIAQSIDTVPVFVGEVLVGDNIPIVDTTETNKFEIGSSAYLYTTFTDNIRESTFSPNSFNLQCQSGGSQCASIGTPIRVGSQFENIFKQYLVPLSIHSTPTALNVSIPSGGVQDIIGSVNPLTTIPLITIVAPESTPQISPAPIFDNPQINGIQGIENITGSTLNVAVQNLSVGVPYFLVVKNYPYEIGRQSSFIKRRIVPTSTSEVYAIPHTFVDGVIVAYTILDNTQEARVGSTTYTQRDTTPPTYVGEVGLFDSVRASSQTVALKFNEYTKCNALQATITGIGTITTSFALGNNAHPIKTEYAIECSLTVTGVSGSSFTGISIYNFIDIYNNVSSSQISITNKKTLFSTEKPHITFINNPNGVIIKSGSRNVDVYGSFSSGVNNNVGLNNLIPEPTTVPLPFSVVTVRNAEFLSIGANSYELFISDHVSGDSITILPLSEPSTQYCDVQKKINTQRQTVWVFTFKKSGGDCIFSLTETKSGKTVSQSDNRITVRESIFNANAFVYSGATLNQQRVRSIATIALPSGINCPSTLPVFSYTNFIHDPIIKLTARGSCFEVVYGGIIADGSTPTISYLIDQPQPTPPQLIQLQPTMHSDGSAYKFTFTVPEKVQQGVIRYTLNPGAVIDLAGNTNDTIIGNEITYDTRKPYITNITWQGGQNGLITSNSTVNAIITFNEPLAISNIPSVDVKVGTKNVPSVTCAYYQNTTNMISCPIPITSPTSVVPVEPTPYGSLLITKLFANGATDTIGNALQNAEDATQKVTVRNTLSSVNPSASTQTQSEVNTTFEFSSALSGTPLVEVSKCGVDGTLHLATITDGPFTQRRISFSIPATMWTSQASTSNNRKYYYTHNSSTRYYRYIQPNALPVHISGTVNGFSYVAAKARVHPVIGEQINTTGYKKLTQLILLHAGGGYITTPHISIDPPVNAIAWISNDPAIQNEYYSYSSNGVTNYYKFTQTGTLGSVPPTHTAGVFNHFEYVGSLATATATIDRGIITGMNIIHAGDGYTHIPTVTIDSPVTAHELPIITSASSVVDVDRLVHNRYYSYFDLNNSNTLYYQYIPILTGTPPIHSSGNINNLEFISEGCTYTIIPNGSYGVGGGLLVDSIIDNGVIATDDVLPIPSNFMTHVSSYPVPVSSGGGGGGGGGGGVLAPVVDVNTRESTKTQVSLFDITKTTTKEIDSAQLQSFAFERTLYIGTRGEDVRELQKFLNTNNFVIVATGLGSPGKETDLYTIAVGGALREYQKAHKLSITGTLNEETRIHINKKIEETDIAREKKIVELKAILASLVAQLKVLYAKRELEIARINAQQKKQINATQKKEDSVIIAEQQRKEKLPTIIFTRPLSVGDTGDDVRALQVFLNANGFFVALTGEGSVGNETTVYTKSVGERVREYKESIKSQVPRITVNAIFDFTTLGYINSLK
ncbi:MAG: peptidoglycan-binding domain-containing protein [Alphaproteobacteria bacterium]|nr:peptidoglycan-binding domain-containing protein [Alphaproteobacteria bacterium]